MTVSVNIEAKAKVTFNLTYEELLTRRRGIYEQTIHIKPGVVVPQFKTRININEVLPVSFINVKSFKNDIDNGLADDSSKNAATFYPNYILPIKLKM